MLIIGSMEDLEDDQEDATKFNTQSRECHKEGPTGEAIVEKNLVPRKGVVFSSINDAFECYNSYARVNGFGIRRSSSS